MLRLLSVIVAAGLLTAVISCGGGNGVPSPTGPTPTPRATVFPPRPEDQLTMCVGTVEATREFQVEAVSRIRTAMSMIMGLEVYSRAFPSGSPPIIDSYCPRPPAVYDPAALLVSPPASFRDVRGRSVDVPGYYHTAVFVLGGDEIQRFAGADDWRATAEEIGWQGDVGFPTTYGLYLGPADLEDLARLVHRLEKHFGLSID